MGGGIGRRVSAFRYVPRHVHVPGSTMVAAAVAASG